MTGLALAASSVLTSVGLPAAAEPAGAGATADGGRGPGTATTAEPGKKAQVVQAAVAAPAAGDPIDMPTSYPYQPELRLYRDNPDDAAHTAALLGHPDLAPKLVELMGKSDRISTQVVGQSTQGRDLYLVTLTAPERAEDTAQQTAWREKIKTDPTAAAADTDLLAQYKTPVWISNNIHGNEWEGTDAAMQYIEWLATAPMSEVGSILRNNRLYFSPSLNPDGRTNATRATAIGLDPNRDMITNSTPETQSFIRQAQAIQPIYAADFHGYTSVLQMEPTGPPHGSNYEYDLYMPHNYALALKVEQDVVAAAIPGNTYFNVTTRQVSQTNTGPDTAHIKIPYRDTPDGWDDFPPIFTAQYAAFFGAASATVELPLGRGAAGGRQTPERAAINTEVALETMESIVGYMNSTANAREMLKNQIEVFRRGSAGEPKDALTVDEVGSVPGPTQWQPLWDVADDQEPVTLPRAYVIPVGEDQRSASDAAALVRQLLFHDIEVGTLDAATTVGGTTYPKGSYVVDMHQPLRGLANSLLDLGEDISAKVPSMYDISAWSYSYTWGATVDKVGLTQDAPLGATTPITTATANAGVPAKADYLTFDVAGVADFRTVNDLLEGGVKVSMLEDGSVVVGPESANAVAAAAEENDIAVEAASKADLMALDDEGTKALSDLTIGYVGTQDDRLSLLELGFDDLVALSVASLNADATLLKDVDVLWIASGFNPANPSVARTAVQDFVNRGGSLLGRTNNGFNAAVSFGLLTGTVVNGNGSGNGIVAVDTPADSILAPYAQDTSFIYPAFSFTGLGEGVEVAQSYDATDPFLAGHWRGTNATNGPEGAAGKASVVSNEIASGARTVVFGTSVFFRNHPKGGMSQAARALHWAGPKGEPVVAPAPQPAKAASSLQLTVKQVGKVKKGQGKAKVTITFKVPDLATRGTVVLSDNGKTARVVKVSSGKSKTVTLRLSKGKHKIVATYAGSDQVKASKARLQVRIR
ncbi:M14 family zinc carboxypeptidase [Nocardioides dongkuii]|uniref:M14 family zinc carboxypeptidase n=1 Tax=Nocardioides dongkuii TaxID=2760089 RepID=UPI001C705295|nr:M14 family zinc carboxypeptidase [Nocardioides dongkuii]